MQRNKPKGVWLLGALLGVSSAYAQPVDNSGLDEIVVTARKQVENLQEVPLSVIAVSAEQVERRSINDLADLQKLTPGFTWSEGLSQLDIRPAIRGQSNIRAASQPTVGIFIDGNSVPWRSGLNLQTVDVERIEVVKGPQSALFGRGVLSGAVNYVTQRPRDEFGGYVEALGASDGRTDFRGRLDYPVNDTLALAFTARWSEFDGFYRNNLTGRDGVGAEETRSGGAALLFEPSENFSAYLRASYSWEAQAQSAWHVVASNTQTGPMATQVWYRGEVRANPALIAHNCDACAGTDRNTTWVTLNLDWQIGGGTLTSMTAYNKTLVYFDGDIDFSGLSEATPPVGPFQNALRQVINRDIDSIGQEIRFASDQDRAVRWLVGAYYYDEKVDEFGQSITGTVLTPAQVPRTPLRNDVTSTSVFGSLALDLTPRLTATAELRWNEDDATTNFIFSGQPRQLSNTWEAWLPRISLDFKWNDNVMLYASAAQGTKPGGFNTTLGAGAVQLPAELLPFDEEEAWSYELGVKSTLLDRRLILNAALFRTDWKGIQVDSQFIPPPPAVGTVGYTSNAGKGEIEGFELEARWQATERLTLSAGYAYTPARIFDYQDSRATAAGISTLGEKQLPYSSDSTATASILYDTPLTNDWRGYAQLDGVYRSTQYASVANLAETGDRTVVDLRLGLVTDSWEIAGFVTNLFDDDTALNVSPFVNVQTFARNFIVAVPDPRQYGIRIRYTF
jgi:iron complex outermembrane receptor protein